MQTFFSAKARQRFVAGSAAAILAALSIFVPAAARADDSHIAVFAGGQLDFANYVFAGVTFALPGATIGKGFAVRALATAGGYNYDGGDLGVVSAKFGGAEIDAVYQIMHQHSWADVSLGANSTYTGLTPDDPNNRLRGTQVEGRIGLEGGSVSGPLRIDWGGYYGLRLSDYEALIGATHQLSPTWRLGAQIYSEGNPSYSLYQVGPYAGVTIAKNSELEFSTGLAMQSGFRGRAYFKALIYQRI